MPKTILNVIWTKIESNWQEIRWNIRSDLDALVREKYDNCKKRSVSPPLVLDHSDLVM